MQTTIALFKMQEGLLESTPQSLLQGSIQFRDDKFFTIKHGDWQSGIVDMVTVLISLFSMAAAWTTLYLKMPYTTRWKRGSDGQADEGKPPFQASKNMIWSLPVMVINIVPKILNITFFCGAFMVSSCIQSSALVIPSHNETSIEITMSPLCHHNVTIDKNDDDQDFKYLICFLILGGLLILYVTLMLIFYRTRLNITQNPKLLLLNLATGPFGQCIVLHPSSNVLMCTGVVSTVFHLLLLCSLRVLASIDPKLLNKDHDDIRMAVMAVALLLSLLSTWLLHFLSKEDNRQWFGLKTGIFGSLSCEKDETLLWAASQNYHFFNDNAVKKRPSEYTKFTTSISKKFKKFQKS